MAPPLVNRSLPTGGVRLDVEIRIRVDEITRAHELAFLDANLALDNLAKREVKLNKWQWPVGQSPRDVVDRGGLGSSIQVVPDSPTEFVHSVGVDYAAPVLLGYRVRTRSGFRNMPARNIYAEPLTKFARIFASSFGRRSSS